MEMGHFWGRYRLTVIALVIIGFRRGVPRLPPMKSRS